MSEPEVPDNVIHVAFGRAQLRRTPDGSVALEGRGRVTAPTAEPFPEAPPPELRERAPDPTADLYSTSEVSRVTGIPASRLRSWDRSGFLQPSGRRGSKKLYTFQDLIGLRTARGLLDEGVPLRAVRRSIEALRASLPRVTKPLAELRVVADGQHVVVRTQERAFEPETGQLVLDFQVRTLRDDVVRMLRPESRGGVDRRAAYEHYLEGCRLDEDEATFDRAEEAYRKAIELDPQLANALTNLGNLRFRRGFAEDAEVLYRRALGLDPAQPEAHYNLGFLAYERGDARGAAELFRRAIEGDPSFADAHFNLAMAAEECGDSKTARTHWEVYLELDPKGPWAEIARRHLLAPR